MNIHHLVGVSEDLGFVFLDPGHLVDGGGDAGGLSGELVDVFTAVAADSLGGAAVEPQDAVSERTAVLVEGGEGLALVGDADCRDMAAVCRRELGDHLPDGRAAAFPPTDRVVLVLVHRGGVQLNVLLRRVPDVSLCVDDDRLRGCRRRVNRDDERTVCQILVLGHDAFASPVNDNC